MKKKSLVAVSKLFLLLSIVLINQCNGQQKKAECPCTAQIAKLISHAYVYSLPILGNDQYITNLIRSNAQYFREHGQAIQCLHLLANIYIKGAIKSYSSVDYDRAYNKVIEMGGTGEMAGEAVNNLKKGSIDMMTLGYELNWLARVLPSAANGNWWQYNNTGTDTRKLIKEALPFILVMLSQDSEFAQMLQIEMGTLNVFLPKVEYEIMLVALMICKE